MVSDGRWDSNHSHCNQMEKDEIPPRRAKFSPIPLITKMSTTTNSPQQDDILDDFLYAGILLSHLTINKQQGPETQNGYSKSLLHIPNWSPPQMTTEILPFISPLQMATTVPSLSYLPYIHRQSPLWSQLFDLRLGFSR